MASSVTLAAGLVLNETYELVGLIGSGGMGAVWQASHRRLPKGVAVKVLKGDFDGDPEFAARFRREAEIASRLQHPHIVEAMDFNTLPDGTPYLVLELLRGESLRQRLQRGPLPLGEAIGIAREAASGLQAAHGQGVVHRDLKPENIFLCLVEGEDRPQAKILDFGLSRILTGETSLTKAGAVFGTPLYMSPEQAIGQSAEASSDQYALAVVVYEMLAGRPPFLGEQAVQILYQVVHQPPPPLQSLAPTTPEEVVAVIERGLAKEAAARYPEVRDFVAALARAAGFPSSLSSSAISVGGGGGGRPNAIAAAQTITSDTSTSLPPSGVNPPGPPRLGAATWPLPPSGVNPPGPPGVTPVPPLATTGLGVASAATVVSGARITALASAAVTPASTPTATASPVGAVLPTLPSTDGATPSALSVPPQVLSTIGGLAGPASTLPPPRGRAGRWLIAALVVLGVGGGGIALWSHRSLPSADVAAPAGDAARGDGAAGRRARELASPARDASPPRREASVAAARPDAGGEADAGAASHRPSPKKVTAPAAVLSPELEEDRRLAQRALNKHDWEGAIAIGERLLRNLPAGAKGIAYDILARGACGRRDLGAYRGHVDNVPRPQRAKVREYCRQHGIVD